MEGFDNLKELDCSQNKLTKLNVSDCPQLKTLDCSLNELEHLNLTNLEQLEEFACNDNNLTNLDFLSSNLKKLTSLNISDNNLSERNLSIFSQFVNLENLLIGNEDEKKIKIYNRFRGSLEPLKNLTKLKLLYISNTDIDSGLEYLPDSLEVVYCSTKKRPESKVVKLVRKLSNKFLIDEDREGYDFQDWRNESKAQIEIPPK